MKNVRYQKLRKTMLFLWFMVMPITFNLMSPVLIIMAGFERTINMSLIIFSLWFLSSFLFGRAYCSIACPWGAMQEIYANLVPKKLYKTRKYKLRYMKYPIFVIWIAFIIMGPLISGG